MQDVENLKPRGKSVYIKVTLAMIILGGFLVALYFSKGITLKNAAPETQQTAEVIQDKNISDNMALGSVVHIACENADVSGTSLGSGIIISKDGLILTNAHVIPHDNTYLNVFNDGCTILLPNPKEEGMMLPTTYLAKPKILKDIGDKYDLATLKIYDFASKDYTAKIQNELNNFPVFNISNSCSIKSLKLGEKIIIYGYPDTGDNLSLVMTKGIISSFPGDGKIITETKINAGSSGGLAISEKGCFVGIPEATYEGRDESYGYIISSDLISRFMEESKKNIGTLGEDTLRLNRERILNYYNDTPPYYSTFYENKNSEGIKTVIGFSDKFYILTIGDNDLDIDTAAIFVTYNSLDDKSSLGSAFYIMGEFAGVLDTSLQGKNIKIFEDMMTEFKNDPTKAIKRTLNGRNLNFGILPDDKAIYFIFSKESLESPEEIATNDVNSATNQAESQSFIIINPFNPKVKNNSGSYIISGSTSSDCKAIFVKAINDTAGISDTHVLEKYKYGNTKFEYYMRKDLNNIGNGVNTYKFTAICDNGNFSDSIEVKI